MKAGSNAMQQSQNASADHTGIPRNVLIAAFVLVSFTIVASGFGRMSDVGTSRMPAAREVAVLSILFEDQADGGVLIRDADTRAAIETLEPGSNGFIRATMRGFVRERKRSGIGAEPPFALIRWSDGAISLEDRSTGRHADLDAFGATNAGAFAVLFAKARRT